MLLQLIIASGAWLEGCREVDYLKQVLGRLRERSWSQVTPDSLANLSPRGARLLVPGCSLHADLATYGWNGRVLDDRCFCCETFEFTEGGALRSVVFHHSATSYGEVIEASRELAMSVKSAADVQRATKEWSASNPREVEARFDWKEGRNDFSMNVAVERQGRAWTVRLNWSLRSVDE